MQDTSPHDDRACPSYLLRGRSNSTYSTTLAEWNIKKLKIISAHHNLNPLQVGISLCIQRTVAVVDVIVVTKPMLQFHLSIPFNSMLENSVLFQKSFRKSNVPFWQVKAIKIVCVLVLKKAISPLCLYAITAHRDWVPLSVKALCDPLGIIGASLNFKKALFYFITMNLLSQSHSQVNQTNCGPTQLI